MLKHRVNSSMLNTRMQVSKCVLHVSSSVKAVLRVYVFICLLCYDTQIGDKLIDGTDYPVGSHMVK